MPLLSTRISRLAGASWRSILYWSPEQPPPTTATRSTPFGRPCFVSNELTFLAALGVTLTSRSSPTRNAGGLAAFGAALEIIARASYRRTTRGSTQTGSGHRERLDAEELPAEDVEAGKPFHFREFTGQIRDDHRLAQIRATGNPVGEVSAGRPTE